MSEYLYARGTMHDSSGQYDDCSEYVEALERLARAAIAKEEAGHGIRDNYDPKEPRAKAEYAMALAAVRKLVKP